MNAKYRSNTKRMILALHGRVTVECGNEVVGYFDSGLRSSAMEKQVPRARKKALGMTKIKNKPLPVMVQFGLRDRPVEREIPSARFACSGQALHSA
jgi:hypothetical protein